MADVQPSPEDLAAKTVWGSAYSIVASAVTLLLGAGRSILMARLLAPSDFGQVAFALTFLNLTAPLRDWGVDLALIHRRTDPHSSADDTLAVHFTLRVALIGAYALLLLVAAPVLVRLYPRKTLLGPIIWALASGEILSALSATPVALLRKEMRFTELAVLQVLTSLSMTIAGPLMAWHGWGLWAVVGERISGALGAIIVVWVVIRPWRPRWKLDRTMFKWYVDYGKYVFVARSMTHVLDHFDDFWVGTALGTATLGLYSKAYEFANYPGRIISAPVVSVFFSTFARIQHDRGRLSRAFNYVASLIVRVGFGVSGAAILLAPTLVPLVLGERWRPMVSIVQWMSIYTLLSPLLSIMGNLANAVGAPHLTARTRLLQALLFVPCVVAGAYLDGADGVAIAVDLAMLVGIGTFLLQLREFVDITLGQLLGVPLIAMAVSISTSWYGQRLWVHSYVSPWAVAGLIGGGFAILYVFVLMVLEYAKLRSYVRTVKRALTAEE